MNNIEFPKTVESKEKMDKILCIRDFNLFKKGDTFSDIIILGRSADYFIFIDRIHYYKDLETGLINKYYHGDKKFFNIKGDFISPANMMKYLYSCDCISNEDAYNKQQELQ